MTKHITKSFLKKLNEYNLLDYEKIISKESSCFGKIFLQQNYISYYSLYLLNNIYGLTDKEKLSKLQQIRNQKNMTLGEIIYRLSRTNKNKVLVNILKKYNVLRNKMIHNLICEYKNIENAQAKAEMVIHQGDIAIKKLKFILEKLISKEIKTLTKEYEKNNQ